MSPCLHHELTSIPQVNVYTMTSYKYLEYIKDKVHFIKDYIQLYSWPSLGPPCSWGAGCYVTDKVWPLCLAIFPLLPPAAPCLASLRLLGMTFAAAGRLLPHLAAG